MAANTVAALTSTPTLNSHRKLTSSSLEKFRTARLPILTPSFAATTVKRTETTRPLTTITNVLSYFRVNYEITPEAMEVEEGEVRATLNDYFEHSKDFIKPEHAGPPRWFSPVECRSARMSNRPVLLFLPGIDGVGLGLMLNHQRLGAVFNIQCLHIPAMDRTSFTDLVKLVERAMLMENCHSPNRPIYLVGESLGACIALAVAARNPDIDLVLVLANPASSFSRSMLEPLIPVITAMHDDIYAGLPYTFSLATGDPLRLAMASFVKGLPLQQTFGDLSQSLASLSSYISVMLDLLPRETLVWKLQLLKSSAEYVNSRLHAIKAQTLLLVSGKDQFLPSQEEGAQLCRALQNCEVRNFEGSGHFLFLEGSVDLLTVLKGASVYRRGRYHDFVSDYVPLTSSEFMQVSAQHSWAEKATSPVMLSTLADGKIVRGLSGVPSEGLVWAEKATSPVMLSTLADGKIVRGLSGVPSEGPVLFVGYHMLLGIDLFALFSHFYKEKGIHLRGMAHPLLFFPSSGGLLPDRSMYDTARVVGAVPVSAKYLYKLFSVNSHVLLYPGGVREALHRKGEEYKLFWPEQQELVRMAAKFGATIIPFGGVGEDDVSEVVFDYEDQMKIPYVASLIQELTDEAGKLRGDAIGEVSNQDVHLPGFIPKVPGRFYFLFGKPIKTAGLAQEMKNKSKSHGMYLHVKSEVESCISYLKEKRKHDPYRHIVPRLLYQSIHGFSGEVPTFEL